MTFIILLSLLAIFIGYKAMQLRDYLISDEYKRKKKHKQMKKNLEKAEKYRRMKWQDPYH